MNASRWAMSILAVTAVIAASVLFAAEPAKKAVAQTPPD